MERTPPQGIYAERAHCGPQPSVWKPRRARSHRPGPEGQTRPLGQAAQGSHSKMSWKPSILCHSEKNNIPREMRQLEKKKNNPQIKISNEVMEKEKESSK